MNISIIAIFLFICPYFHHFSFSSSRFFMFSLLLFYLSYHPLFFFLSFNLTYIDLHNFTKNITLIFPLYPPISLLLPRYCLLFTLSSSIILYFHLIFCYSYIYGFDPNSSVLFFPLSLLYLTSISFSFIFLYYSLFPFICMFNATSHIYSQVCSFFSLLSLLFTSLLLLSPTRLLLNLVTFPRCLKYNLKWRSNLFFTQHFANDHSCLPLSVLHKPFVSSFFRVFLFYGSSIFYNLRLLVFAVRLR